MKIHPEVQDIVQEQMGRLLRHDTTYTPEQIIERVRKNLNAQQKTLHADELRAGTKQLVGHKVYDCECMKLYWTHVPWCEQKFHIEFTTEAAEQTINGRTFRFGSSAFGI